MLKKNTQVQNHKRTTKVWIAALIFFAVVWLYPVYMKNIVLWMDTSEDTEAVVVAQLLWDDGNGFSEERKSENAIVSQEVFVRVPRQAKKTAEQYRLTLQNEKKDIAISEIKLNGDRIPVERFIQYVAATENLQLELQDGVIIAHVSGDNPSITFNDDFTKLIRKKWHMANVSRLWLSLAGVIGTIWGLIYVKMEDKE